MLFFNQDYFWLPIFEQGGLSFTSLLCASIISNILLPCNCSTLRPTSILALTIWSVSGYHILSGLRKLGSNKNMTGLHRPQLEVVWLSQVYIQSVQFGHILQKNNELFIKLKGHCTAPLVWQGLQVVALASKSILARRDFKINEAHLWHCFFHLNRHGSGHSSPCQPMLFFNHFYIWPHIYKWTKTIFKLALGLALAHDFQADSGSLSCVCIEVFLFNIFGVFKRIYSVLSCSSVRFRQQNYVVRFMLQYYLDEFW